MALLETTDALTLVRGGAVFGFVLTLWLIGVLVWFLRRSTKENKLRQRLELDPEFEEAPGGSRTLRLWHEGREATRLVPGLDLKPTLEERLDQLRKDAGWDVPLQTIVINLGLVALGVVILVLLLTGSALAAFVGGVAVVLVFLWWANVRIASREAIFEQQLIDALELCARALRAGHPLYGSFQLIAEEIPAPVGIVFAEVCQQQSLGGSLEGALRRAAALTRSSDMKLFAASLAINMRTGGNLAEVVDGLAKVIRERVRLNRRFRVLTAQTQISKRILIALPVIMFVVLSMLNPGYMQVFYGTFVGQVMFAGGATGLLIGWWVMNRMAVLRT